MTVTCTFVSTIPDLSAFEALMREFYTIISQKVLAAGGPSLSPDKMARDTVRAVDSLLPPTGRTVLAMDESGALVGCGVMRLIRPDAVEFKRMFVRPEAQGTGLGWRLFQLRLDEAQRMGCRFVYADTVKGNTAMLTMYDKLGFERISRYPENANDAALDPFLVYLKRSVDAPQDRGARR